MINTVPWSGGTDEEYETQHFGFGAQRLKIAIRQMVEQKITNGVKDMESYLKESLRLNDKDKATITHSFDKLIKLFCDRAEPSLDIIDGEIERIFRIPSNVLLPEDEAQLQDISDTDYESLKAEVADLRKRVERGVLMEALLTAEEEELSSIENICETAKKDMKLLDLLHKSIDGSDSLKTIQNDTQFLCASVPYIMKNNSGVELFED
ncbi:protein MIS12 homolog [Galleria mellonella]|uniref:Protein MIS12 homolog n=1 Tax=Galleria mellonella TaxID=7137 RepID=A0ABM3MZP9_GALME|nr:protein MIS12 homolog [Galleria mellonella]XP_052756814.1 protein MIS12 homolog [Galleria mellonella]